MNEQASFNPMSKCLLSVAIAAVVVLAGSGAPVQSASQVRNTPSQAPLKDLTTPPALPSTMVFPAAPIATSANVGYLPADWNVSPTGSFDYTIPIEVPDGRAGMQPSLALNYSSASTDNGLLGVGWTLSGLSAITRCGKSISVEKEVDGVDYGQDIADGDIESETDLDRLCLDGQKLVLISGHYGVDAANTAGSEYRTWHDSFAKIVYEGPANQYAFAVRGKDGIERRYLPSPVWVLQGGVFVAKAKDMPRYSGSVDDIESVANVIDDWLLVSETDRSGNQVRYHYDHEFVVEYDDVGAFQHLPKMIEYTLNGSAAAYRKVEFQYGGRSDNETQWRSGVRHDLIKRLTAITMSAPMPSAGVANTGKAWRYNFEYIASDNSQRSLLASVQKCGINRYGQTGGCLWKKEFDWHTQNNLQFETGTLPVAIDLSGQNAVDVPKAKYPFVNVFDADGDGKDDVMTSQLGLSDYPWLFTTRGPQGQYLPSGLGFLWYSHGVVTPNGPIHPHFSGPLAVQVDFNGSGGTELFVRQFKPGHPDRCIRNVVYWNSANDAFEDVALVPGVVGQTYQEHDCSKVPNSLFADMNGDRLVDHFSWDPGLDPVQWKLSHNNGNGGFITLPNSGVQTPGPAHSPWGFFGPTWISNAISFKPAVIIDFNGDGMKEVYRHPNLFAFDESAHLVKSTVDPKRVFESAGGEILGDFNGDGLRDAVVVRQESENGRLVCKTKLRWNTGNGLGFWIESPLAFSDCGNGTARVADINGDGRDDIVWFSHRNASENVTFFLLSMGHGPFVAKQFFGHEPLWADHPLDSGNPGALKVWPHGIANELDTSHPIGYDTNACPWPPAPNVPCDINDYPIYAPFVPFVYGRDEFPTSRLGDFNGDGLVDLLGLDTTSDPAHPDLNVMYQKSQFADRIKAVYDEKTLWPREEIVYSRSWSEKPEAVAPCSHPLSCMKQGTPVVSQVNSRAHLVDPANAAAETSARRLYYSYEDPVSERQGRGFLGFRKVRVWDPARPAETVTNYQNRLDQDDFYDEFATQYYVPYAMRPTSVTTVVALNAVSDPPPERGLGLSPARVTRVLYTNAIMKLNGNKTYVDLPDTWQSKEWEQAVGIDWGTLETNPVNPTSEHMFGIVEPSQPLRTRHGHVKFDSYGNVRESLDVTHGGTTSLVVSQFDNDPAQWLIGQLRHQTVTATEPGQPSVSRRMDYDYDGKGHLIAAYVEKLLVNSPELRSTTTINYDAVYGLPNKIETLSGDGLASRTAHIEYAPLWPGQPDERVYASQVWSPHPVAAYRPSSWTAVHPAYGVTVASMDANGVHSVANYDDLGRLVYASDDGNAPVAVGYAPRFDAAGGFNGLKISATVAGPVAGQGQKGEVASDALGRPIRSGTIGFSGAWTWNDASYDVLGRLVRASRPFQGANPFHTRMEYDPLDRLLKKIHPDNSESKHSHGFYETRSWDADGNENRVVRDRDNRVVQSIDMLNGVPVMTSYSYAAFGAIDTVTDDKGNKTISFYDRLGRVIHQGDLDSGTTKLSYNGLGELREKLHLESGDKTSYLYDSLGRPTGETGPDGITKLTWDTQPHGIGKLASTSSPDQVATVHHYDTAGRSAGFDEIIDGKAYSMSTSFDPYGRVDQLQYPAVSANVAGIAVKHGYTPHEYVGELGYSAPGLPYTKLWQAQSRNLDDALIQATFGSNGLDQRAYDASTGKLNALLAFSGINKIADLKYLYQANGLVRERNDVVNGRKETFSYDALRRLKTWTLDHIGTSRLTEYGYDTLGNLLNVRLNQTLIEDNSYGELGGGRPHALTKQKFNGVTTIYVYDKRGRQIEMGNAVRKLTYSDFDLPRTVTVNGQQSKLSYNAFGERVKKSGPNGTTVYIADLYEKRVVGATTEHVYHVQGPDGAIAQIVHNEATNQKTVQYTLTDALGSVGAVIDGANGLVTNRFYFDPFGKRIEANGTAFAGVVGKLRKGFTGHEHDDDFGLINMRGRMYDSQLKRMLTPDPHVTVPRFGQSWNPYSYVMNSPLNLTDPTGFDCSAAVTGGTICSSGDGLTQTHTKSGPDGAANGASGISTYGRSSIHNEIPKEQRLDPPATGVDTETKASEEFDDGWRPETCDHCDSEIEGYIAAFAARQVGAGLLTNVGTRSGSTTVLWAGKWAKEAALALGSKYPYNNVLELSNIYRFSKWFTTAITPLWNFENSLRAKGLLPPLAPGQYSFVGRFVYKFVWTPVSGVWAFSGGAGGNKLYEVWGKGFAEGRPYGTILTGTERPAYAAGKAAIPTLRVAGALLNALGTGISLGTAIVDAQNGDYLYAAGNGLGGVGGMLTIGGIIVASPVLATGGTIVGGVGGMVVLTASRVGSERWPIRFSKY